MRSLLTLFACLMLVATAWGGTAQAAGIACSEMTDRVAAHVAGDCGDVPADAGKDYPHCHTGCHGHDIAAPIPTPAAGTTATVARAYAVAADTVLTAHKVDRTLRPPQA